MADLHLEFCDGKSWVRLLDEKVAINSREDAGDLTHKSSFLGGCVHVCVCVCVCTCWHSHFWHSLYQQATFASEVSSPAFKRV